MLADNIVANNGNKDYQYSAKNKQKKKSKESGQQIL